MKFKTCKLVVEQMMENNGFTVRECIEGTGLLMLQTKAYNVIAQEIRITVCSDLSVIVEEVFNGTEIETKSIRDAIRKELEHTLKLINTYMEPMKQQIYEELQEVFQ